MTLTSVNPATEEIVATFDETSDHEVADRLAAAAHAYVSWAHLPVARRAALLSSAAVQLEREREQLAALMTLEMGKPIGAAREEITKCAGALRFYAESAAAFLETHPVKLGGETAHIAYQPLGVVLAIMPWNFPFWQVIRFAAPALVAGNVAVLKHASNVPQCALAIERVLAQAGFPQGVFQVVLLPAARVEPIIADERVAAVTLTGSERAGSEVASAAGRHLKKSVLELGGSDPFVILPSADIRLAARMAATARTVNSGQSCIAAKRFIVVESIARDFQAAFVDAMRSLRTGDPTRDETQVGPLATAQVLHDVERQVGAARAAGARVALGGERPRGKGFFYPPTVLLDVDPGSPVCTEEVFGPVAPVLVARDVGHALTLANASRYGLGASVWTTDRSDMDMFTRELESGMVFVNAVVHSDARLPFGGVKHSGYGRELGKTGLREFVNVKTIRVREEPAEG